MSFSLIAISTGATRDNIWFSLLGVGKMGNERHLIGFFKTYEYIEVEIFFLRFGKYL